MLEGFVQISTLCTAAMKKADSMLGLLGKKRYYDVATFSESDFLGIRMLEIMGSDLNQLTKFT